MQQMTYPLNSHLYLVLLGVVYFIHNRYNFNFWDRRRAPFLKKIQSTDTYKSIYCCALDSFGKRAR